MRYSSIKAIHFYTTLVLMVPLILASVTGAILVYGPELQRAFAPGGWSVTPSGTPLPPPEILDRVQEQRPDLPVWALTLAEAENLPHTAWLSGGKGVVNIDPYTGDILVHFRPNETFQGWVTALHRRYLAEGKPARWTRHVVSVVALLMAFEICIGLWLWLKLPNRLKRLVVPKGRSTVVTVLRLHQLTGVLTALLLLTVAYTGMALYWHNPMQWVLETLTFSEVAQENPPKFEGLAPLEDLRAALSLAAAVPATANADLRTIRPPDRKGGPAIMTYFAEGQTMPTKVWIGDQPARVLHVQDGRDVTLATWLWHMKYQIHVGTFAGPVVRVFWIVLALTPAGFVISGLWLHLKRRKKPARDRQSAG
ncbi:hypothetical protein EOI86_02180 [Hwanghaeella grinnelliae]|uniref:PepSY domain-containing protein n=1 Tax=Hwanghaeella grinnelliae TaxID=2500179 RepID=A0A437QUF0_9PROT|nr:PepSY-associated TM helix domain-containing protein [Hwanghaeella grinnelliae]RVU38133.1 hypothetical protein EOI86_02180 [Hwanghaeella grinnelliae]